MNRSFEDELTFVPKLNSLSMKLAGSSSTRTSIMERCPKEKSNELDSSYTFQPVVGSHSSKIVAKLKTGFWERQKLHVKRQKEKLEQGPSTMHRDHKRNSQKDLNDPNINDKSKIKNSLSDDTCLHNNNNKQDSPRKQQQQQQQRNSPYSKSVDSLKDKRKEICQELSNFRKKYYKSPRSPNFSPELLSTTTTTTTNNKKNKNKTKNEITDRMKASSTASTKTVGSKENVVMISPRKTKSLSPNLRYRKSDSRSNLMKTPPSHTISSSAMEVADKTRSGMLAITIPTKSRTDKMDLEHQRLMRAKKIASEALKGKKIFVCNGPYSALKTALRKRGWIEKNFKYASACCTVENGEEGETTPLQECQNQIDEGGGAVDDENSEGGGGGGIEESEGGQFLTTGNGPNQNNKNNGSNTSRDNTKIIPKTNGKQNNNNNNNEIETRTSAEDFSKVFSSDSQYGIMSRIVRNFAPTLIWTLRRDDINFRLLQKEQIVNHYTAAWTFTTKTGLCVNLRNILAFDSKDWRTFFPRCYRLCCQEERAEFLSDYRLTMVQSLLKIIVERHDEWRLVEEEKQRLRDEMQDKCYEDCLKSNCSSPLPLPVTKKGCRITRETATLKASQISTILPSSVATLVLKKCYQFLDSRNHRDLDVFEDYGDKCLEELHWSTILNYYNDIIALKSIIASASSHVEECEEVLAQMEKHSPQLAIDGYQNIWILKPGAKSRGRGIEVKNNLQDILNTAGTSVVSQKDNKWVVQKYIERPFLVYRTKFDIRQWFLVTDWNPLTLWFYKDCYIRFCSQEFTLEKFDVQVHLSNNSIQKHFQNGARSSKLPESNMWSSDEFKLYLDSIGEGDQWSTKVYPGMKSSIVAALQCCQSSLEYRKNSFELYGADFMLSENFNPWLIEINSSPALGASTPVTERLCRNVIEDTLKVVLDRRDNRQADVGRFELAFRQPHIPLPSYMGCSIGIEGTAISQPPKQTKTGKPGSDTKTRLKNSESFSDFFVGNKENGEESNDSKPKKSVSKLVYEKKESSVVTVKHDKSRLDGLIEKLNRSAKGDTKSINHLEKVKSSIAAARMEKERSAAGIVVVKNIEKAISAPKLTKHESAYYLQQQKARALNNEHPVGGKKNVYEKHERKLISKHNNNKTLLSECNGVPFISCTSAITNGAQNLNNAQPPTTSNNQNCNTGHINYNGKNVMTISIAEVMDSKKVIAQNMASCIKAKQKVTLSDSFEPISHQHNINNNGCSGSGQSVVCSCCVQPSESVVEMLCPQVASYDLRVLQKYQHRLEKKKNSKNNNNNNGGGNKKGGKSISADASTVAAAAATAQTRPRQYGAVDADELAGIREAQHKYQQLFLNSYQEGIRKQLQLKPSDPTMDKGDQSS